MTFTKTQIEDIKSGIDCISLIANDLGPAPRRSAKGVMYRCPIHHESKGYSLSVWADGWKCWGKCELSGDVIGWLMHYHGLSFEESAKRLGGQAIQSLPPRRPSAAPEASTEPPAAEWQQAARALVDEAQHYLWSANGTKALEYLRQQRGLSPLFIEEARLGYVPGQPKEWLEVYGLKVPCGILIPRFIGGALWMVNVRRAAGEPKYIMVSGSKLTGSLYGADELLAGWPVLFTEGEFDCIVASQIAGDLVCAVTLGSATNTLQRRWYAELANAPKIFSLLDNDTAGNKAAIQLGSISKRVKRVIVPEGKDLTDFLKATNFATVRAWIEGLL